MHKVCLRSSGALGHGIKATVVKAATTHFCFILLGGKGKSESFHALNCCLHRILFSRSLVCSSQRFMLFIHGGGGDRHFLDVGLQTRFSFVSLDCPVLRCPHLCMWLAQQLEEDVENRYRDLGFFCRRIIKWAQIFRSALNHIENTSLLAPEYHKNYPALLLSTLEQETFKYFGTRSPLRHLSNL